MQYQFFDLSLLGPNSNVGSLFEKMLVVSILIVSEERRKTMCDALYRILLVNDINSLYSGECIADGYFIS